MTESKKAKVKMEVGVRGYVVAKLYPDSEKNRCLLVIAPDRRGHGRGLITVPCGMVKVRAYRYHAGRTISESRTIFETLPLNELFKSEEWVWDKIFVEGEGEVEVGTDKKGQRIIRIFHSQSNDRSEAYLVGGYFRPVVLPRRDNLMTFVTGHSASGKHGDWWSLLLLTNGDRVVVAEGWRHHRQFKALRCEGGLVEEPVGGDELADLLAMPFWHCKVGEEEVALS